MVLNETMAISKRMNVAGYGRVPGRSQHLAMQRLAVDRAAAARGDERSATAIGVEPDEPRFGIEVMLTAVLPVLLSDAVGARGIR